MTQPRVSVVITTYNTSRYVSETLESVFAQSYPAVEVIVVDDGSTDDSVARARDFGDRITLLERPHEGLGPARNAGIAASTGEYLAFLDSDDLWDPDALRVQVDVALRNPGSGLIVGDGVSFGVPDRPDVPLFDAAVDELFPDARQQEVTGWFYDAFVTGNRVTCPAQTLIPRRVHDVLGPVCTTPNGAQDFDYYLRIARLYPVTFHRAVVAHWRFRHDSMSRDFGERSLHWAVLGLEVIAREREAAVPEHRACVDAAYRAYVRRAAGLARAAHARGTPPNPDDVAALYRIAGREPYVLAARGALALPRALGRALQRVVSRLAALLERSARAAHRPFARGRGGHGVEEPEERSASHDAV